MSEISGVMVEVATASAEQKLDADQSCGGRVDLAQQVTHMRHVVAAFQLPSTPRRAVPVAVARVAAMPPQLPAEYRAARKSMPPERLRVASASAFRR